MLKKTALVVHGGAWTIPDEAIAACEAGCRQALEHGWAVLEKGGTAVDACQEAIVVLEDEPVFDAGTGSHLNRDGRVQLDAILMDGRTLKSGAVCATERLRNPIQVARLVLERSQHMMLVGPGAEQFAVEMGVSLCNPSELVVAREVEAWYKLKHETETARGLFLGNHQLGTVGAVALDAAGNLAAGVEPQAAADRAVALLQERTEGKGGLIVVDGSGRVGFAFSTSHMAFAYRTSELPEPVVGL